MKVNWVINLFIIVKVVFILGNLIILLNLKIWILKINSLLKMFNKNILGWGKRLWCLIIRIRLEINLRIKKIWCKVVKEVILELEIGILFFLSKFTRLLIISFINLLNRKMIYRDIRVIIIILIKVFRIVVNVILLKVNIINNNNNLINKIVRRVGLKESFGWILKIRV